MPPLGRELTIVRIGERARRALVRSDGAATPLPAVPGGPYYIAAGELIWVGARLPAMHPRVVITPHAPSPGAALYFRNLPARGWAPKRLRLERDAMAAFAANLTRLCRALLEDDAPRGFGALLARDIPGFPLDHGVARVEALAQAYRSDAPSAVHAASVALLGFGTGLTPSGDDLAGAALLARRLLAPARTAWSRTGRALAREANARSNTVSAALFEDLVRGRSFAPLHAIAEALAAGEHAAALLHARELTAIGHSSGWDMFTGFVIGITGRCRAA